MKPISECLKVDETSIREVRRQYGREEADIKKLVDILKTCMTEKNLPDDCDERRLERILLGNKFQLQKSIAKLESYYKLRGAYHKYLTMEPGSQDMKELLKQIDIAILPDLTPKKERVIICCLNEDSKEAKMINFVRYMVLCHEIMLVYDYAIGIKIIVDLKNYSLYHLKQFTIPIVRAFLKLYQEAFSGRIISLDILNAPSYFDAIMYVLQIVASKKFISKIKLHKNTESIDVPKDLLPTEYGDGKFTMADIHKDVGNMILCNKEFLVQRRTQITEIHQRQCSIS